ncbi:hypothetical protein GH733_014867 [Mirounga leonina]|nr:hypothetical protein GH733_014867 [Mirounga leonina]
MATHIHQFQPQGVNLGLDRPEFGFWFFTYSYVDSHKSVQAPKRKLICRRGEIAISLHGETQVGWNHADIKEGIPECHEEQSAYQLKRLPRTLALEGRAVEHYTAMEGLLPAIRSTFQLVLEHLWGALLVISESWRHIPGLHEFPWEILSEGDLKSVTDDADSNVSLQSAEEKNEELARQLWEEKQMNKNLQDKQQVFKLRKHLCSLKIHSFKQLKLKLQILSELYQEYIIQLQRKLFEEEMHCLEIEKKLPNTCRKKKSLHQFRNFYKMTEDMGRKFERNASYC